jgi:hypothetical protein
MEFDMRGIGPEHEGKRLRIEFTDGEICEGELDSVCTGNEHSACCGIIFESHTTNRPENHESALERTSHPAIWSEIEFVKDFKII